MIPAWLSKFGWVILSIITLGALVDDDGNVWIKTKGKLSAV